VLTINDEQLSHFLAVPSSSPPSGHLSSADQHSATAGPSRQTSSQARHSNKLDARRQTTRVIRTFQEVEVEKLVNNEVWYEELECGV
jgi:hypothetical protein